MKIKSNLKMLMFIIILGLLITVSAMIIIFNSKMENQNQGIEMSNYLLNSNDEILLSDEFESDLLKINNLIDDSNLVGNSTRIIDVVLINPSDKVIFTNSLALDFVKRFNDNIDDDYLSVHEYYYIMSRGKIDLWANVYVCQVDKDVNYYACQKSSNAVSEVLLWEEARHFGNAQLVSNDYGLVIDAKCTILPCSRGNVDDLSWPHAYFVGLMSLPYNKADVPTLTHESLHMLGLLDLYTNGVKEVVSSYDIMCDTYNGNVSLSAYYREKLGWLSKGKYSTTSEDDIQVLSSDGTYTLNVNTSNSGVIAYEFGKYKADSFYIEYRRNSNTFENYSYGSGLLIYRINSAAQGNLKYENSGLYSMYVFSSSGSYLSKYNGYIKPGKSIGSIDENSSLALTYSDGTKSGFVINNIVENPNGTISFDISSNGSEYLGSKIYSMSEFKSLAVKSIIEVMTAVSEVIINPVAVGKKVVINFTDKDNFVNNINIIDKLTYIVEKINTVYQKYGGADAIKNGKEYIINGISTANNIIQTATNKTKSTLKNIANRIINILNDNFIN